MNRRVSWEQFSLKATSRFNNPWNLRRLIDMIDEEDWSSLNVDVKGAAFEGLLEKAASEGKKGAGQYFTPRPLIQSICRVMKPDPRGKKDSTIADRACGSGGFLVCAYEWLVKESKGVFDRADAKRIRTQTYFGQDLVPRPRRLALMNLYLHGVEPHIYLGDTLYEPDRGERYDVVLTNPPFGTKGANQAPERDDFTVETSNNQLNFVQHVMNALKPGGRAAIVLPDNCLFEEKAGEVFEILMQDCNLHTILRLPRGTFTPYSQGIKANVIFFQKGYPTVSVRIFDGRSNVPGITKKDCLFNSCSILPNSKKRTAKTQTVRARELMGEISDVSVVFRSVQLRSADTNLMSPGLRMNRLRKTTIYPNPKILPPRLSSNSRR